MPLISLVIPCYNEEKSLESLLSALQEGIRDITGCDFEIVFVNDGSTDGTLAQLHSMAARHAGLVIVDLSRNFGKEAALTAGLDTARGDAVIPMDADLQDPPELIAKLIAEWRSGYEVVLARREDRSQDSMAKRLSSRWFYRVHNLVSEVDLPEDVGDFRLMDRVVVEALKLLPENRRFMKGIFAWVGFRTTVVSYARAQRQTGSSRFNAWRLWNLALEGITSFSISPLRIWTYVGVMVALIALGWGAWIVVRTLVHGIDVPGYASVFVAVLFLGGLQLIGIGVIGEYLGRNYLESKRRPAYIIRNITRHGG